MPVSPTYPGVYIEEIPSGVRTISGVRDVHHGLHRLLPTRSHEPSRAGAQLG